MSQVDDLIRELCPEGVSFAALGDLCLIKAGEGINKNRISARPGEYPVINSGREPLGFYREYNVEDDPIGIASRGSVGLVTWTPGRFYRGNLNYSCSVKDPARLDRRLLYHVLLSQDSEISALCTHDGIPALNASNLKKLEVPVPPVPVQKEIVRILDTFTELEAELEAELEERESQFDYYRNAQLTFGVDVPKLPLGEVATVVRGASPRPIKRFMTTADCGLPWIKIGDVPEGDKYIAHTSEYVTAEGATKSRRVMPGDFVLSNSMSFGRPYISKIEGYIHDGWLAIGGFREYFDPDFLYHLLRSAPVQAEFNRRAGAGSVRNLNADIVKSVAVHVPGIEEQRRIVKFLDKFESLTNSVSEGLPAEIAARRKQYEYYRDKLLSFERLAA